MGSWLACTALKGMLPDEIIVLVSTVGGSIVSLFVSKSIVQLEHGSVDELDGKEVKARIQVRVLDCDDHFGLIALPGEPVDGSRIAKVSRTNLSHLGDSQALSA